MLGFVFAKAAGGAFNPALAVVVDPVAAAVAKTPDTVGEARMGAAVAAVDEAFWAASDGPAAIGVLVPFLPAADDNVGNRARR